MAKKVERVLFISQFYNPEQPDVRWHSLASAIQNSGYQVQVLTGFPNYPGGEIYDGYKVKLFQKEIIDGVEVIRVPLYPSHNSSSIGRALNYLSFSFFAIFIGFFLVKRASKIYAYHPPATVSIPAIFYKHVFRASLIYDIQDFWPDTLLESGMLNSPRVLRWISLYMKFVYNQSNKLLVLSNGFKKKLVELGVDAGKIEVVYNWDIGKANNGYLKSIVNPFKKNTLNVLFAGTMGKVQSLGTIVNGLRDFQTNELYKNKVSIYFMGGGIEVENLKKMTALYGLQNIFFIPKVSPDIVEEYLKMADILLINLKKSELFKITIPSKMQTYCKAGKPILAGVEGELSEIISEANCGWTFEPENEEDFISKLKLILSLPKNHFYQIGENARKLYVDKFRKEIGALQIIKILDGA